MKMGNENHSYQFRLENVFNRIHVTKVAFIGGRIAELKSESHFLGGVGVAKKISDSDLQLIYIES